MADKKLDIIFGAQGQQEVINSLGGMNAQFVNVDGNVRKLNTDLDRMAKKGSAAVSSGGGTLMDAVLGTSPAALLRSKQAAIAATKEVSGKLQQANQDSFEIFGGKLLKVGVAARAMEATLRIGNTLSTFSKALTLDTAKEGSKNLDLLKDSTDDLIQAIHSIPFIGGAVASGAELISGRGAAFTAAKASLLEEVRRAGMIKEEANSVRIQGLLNAGGGDAGAIFASEQKRLIEQEGAQEKFKTGGISRDTLARIRANIDREHSQNVAGILAETRKAEAGASQRTSDISFGTRLQKMTFDQRGAKDAEAQKAAIQRKLGLDIENAGIEFQGLSARESTDAGKKRAREAFAERKKALQESAAQEEKNINKSEEENKKNSREAADEILYRTKLNRDLRKAEKGDSVAADEARRLRIAHEFSQEIKAVQEQLQDPFISQRQIEALKAEANTLNAEKGKALEEKLPDKQTVRKIAPAMTDRLTTGLSLAATEGGTEREVIEIQQQAAAAAKKQNQIGDTGNSTLKEIAVAISQMLSEMKKSGQGIFGTN